MFLNNTAIWLLWFLQESLYPSISTNPYKFGYSEAGSFSYYDYDHEYVVNDHVSGIEEHDRHLENPSTATVNVAANVHREEISGSNSLTNSVECKFPFQYLPTVVDMYKF